MRTLELLAPARNAEVAREAILHGADAVYMGASSHGARKSAANSIDDIRRTVEFAHGFRARVYATVNTIVYDRELRDVERLITGLYRAGVDALIVQDMGVLRLDIPPIAIHASTQCDNRTPEKARFLQEAGFSQIVLARELTLPEIKAVCDSVSVPVEVFVHGALCVSYSGRCHASCAANGRSANRGECAQLCRLPYTLADASGKVLAKDRHLLSLKDFNASDCLSALIEAGASSFKIEGRLKDAAYVKNVTAYYRQKLDEIIAAAPGLYRRSSFGKSEISFRPDPAKSFNRSFTHYFLDGPKPSSIASLMTPKSLGEPVADTASLNNGDGISWFTREGEYRGALVNGVDKERIITSDGSRIPKGIPVRRTADIRFQQALAKPTAVRKVAVDISLDQTGISASDERGVEVRLPLGCTLSKARSSQDHSRALLKFGTTIYEPRSFKSSLAEDVFIPASELSALRRRLVEALDAANTDSYRFEPRRPESMDAVYPCSRLDYRDNVANGLAEAFYRNHGVKEIEAALETSPRKGEEGLTVMTTRHCILRELGLCRKDNPEAVRGLKEPLTLRHDRRIYRLAFDCHRCEMKVIVKRME